MKSSARRTARTRPSTACAGGAPRSTSRRRCARSASSTRPSTTTATPESPLSRCDLRPTTAASSQRAGVAFTRMNQARSGREPGVRRNETGCHDIPASAETQQRHRPNRLPRKYAAGGPSDPDTARCCFGGNQQRPLVGDGVRTGRARHRHGGPQSVRRDHSATSSSACRLHGLLPASPREPREFRHA